MYRERARQWLDQRFFREEYDARKILLSLASRVRFETDPADLAAMVVDQIDEALHPRGRAILVSGIEEGRLVAGDGAARQRRIAPARRRSDVDAAMVGRAARDLPRRSTVARAPAAARGTGLAGVHRVPCCSCPSSAQDESLVGVVVLGERKSEEAYTAEDRELLASIAAQMGLGLRRRATAAAHGRTRPVANVTRRG